MIKARTDRLSDWLGWLNVGRLLILLCLYQIN